MSTRKYTINVIDPITNIKYINIDSDNQPFQIKTTINYCNVTEATDFTLLEIYNFSTDLNRNLLIGCKIVVTAGSTENGVLSLNLVNNSMVSPKTVINGYVYDAYYDFGDMPRSKLVFKIYNERVNTSGIEANPTNIMETIVFPKGTDLITFCKTVMRKTYNIDLINNTMAEVIINKSKNFIFKYDKYDNQIIIKLNEFLKKITGSNGMYEYPLCISGSPNGYMLTVDFFQITSAQIQEYITYNKVKGSNYSFASDMFLDIMYNNPTTFSITNNIICQPPFRMDEKTIQLHTLLLPSIRIGDFITIGDASFEGSNFTNVAPKATNSPSIVSQSIAYANDLNGIYVVQSVSHNLNYYDSAPVNWSTIIECVRQADIPLTY